jgi:hypothetical protein
MSDASSLSEPPIAPPSSEDEQHRAAERAYWKRQLCISKCLNIITGGAAAAALVGLIFVAIGLVDNRSATIDANRAWIAPYSAEPIGKDESGRIVFEISFANIGKGPALGLNWKTESDTKPTPSGLDWSLVKFDRNRTCDDLVPIPEGPVTYLAAPGQSPYIRRANSGPKVLFDSIKDGKSVVYLRGCVAYKTMRIIGHSAFCWVFDPMIPDAVGHINGHANLCESGSFAE